MTVRATVVVPTYRRPDLLDRCLSALLAQGLDPGEYEILIADDAAGDETRGQVAKWASRSPPEVRYVRPHPARGPAAARNAGWRAARGRFIAFTDDDCVPEPNWLREGLAALEQGPAAAWGAIRLPLPERPTDYERNESHLAEAGFVTANCFCRRDVLEAVGGFDERFTMAWREDSDLYFTLVEAGHEVARAPAAVVLHPIRPAGWGVSLWQQRKSQFNALLYKKHPALYRRHIQAGPPWRSYAMLLALLAAGAAALAGLPWLALAAAGLWLLLVGLFCARRLRGNSPAPRHVAEMVVTSPVIPLLSVYWRLRGAVRFRVFFL
jgi:GT2 family glycosyltransferase